MKTPRRIILSRIAIFALLYPWLVSFDEPGDTLSNSISIYGGTGSYSYVTGDCADNVISRTPVAFYDYAGAWQTGFGKGFSVRLRGGHIGSGHSFNLIDADSAGAYNPIGITYGGASLDLASPFFGFDLGMLGFSHRVLLSAAGDYTFTGEFRAGYLSAWYFTIDYANNDPLVSARPLVNTSVGFNISPEFSRNHPNLTPPHLWFGFGLGPPYDNEEALGTAELTIPAALQWMITFRASYDFSQFSQGSMSGGVTYRF